MKKGKTKPPHWFEKISTHIQELSAAPLFGNAPSFHWEELSSLLASQFGKENFTVRLKTQEWREPGNLKKGLGIKLLVSSFSLTPIEEPIYWVMSQSDRDKFTACMISDKAKKKAFTSPALQEGYYRFLLLEALQGAQSLEPIQQMTLHLSDSEEIPQQPAICIDVEIAFDECIAWGRLILTEAFRAKWVQHFSAFPPQYTRSSLTEKLPLELGIQIGSVVLSPKEWEKLEVGDFLLPDTIHETKGMLTLVNTPLFQVHLEQNQIQLIDYAFTPEEPMQDSENLSEETLSHKLEISEKESKAVKELPMQIHVELARLKVTLDQLMNLSPGNMLELPSFADKKVILTVNGEKIGVAELVYLGETLGLKILEI